MVNKKDYNLRKSANVGEAYLFFNCNASKQEIETELPTIREAAKTPSELELTLISAADQLEGKNGSLAQQARKSENDYVLRADCRGLTNEKTADELGTIMNVAYASSLYSKGEKFDRWIVYEDDKSKEYIYRE